MGRPKPLLEWEDGTFLDRVILGFHGAVDPIIVVIRERNQQLEREPYAAKYARFVLNPDADRGQLSSLQCGLAAAPGADAFAFCPVDYPAVQPATVKQLLRVCETSDAPVIVPRFDGRHGHPVIVRRAVADELLALPPTATARDVLHRYAAETSYVAVDDGGVLADVDTPEEYDALRQKFGVR